MKIFNYGLVVRDIGRRRSFRTGPSYYSVTVQITFKLLHDSSLSVLPDRCAVLTAVFNCDTITTNLEFKSK